MDKSDKNESSIGDKQKKQPKLPNMNEFSPGVLGNNNIKKLLSNLQPSIGNKEEMINVIINSVEKIKVTSDETQKKNRANNVLIGMSQCGLLEKIDNKISGNFTDLAKNIVDSESDKEANNIFAKHLLEHCCGLELLKSVSMIRDRAEIVSLQTIREELRSSGFLVTENEGNASKIRLWLEGAGVVNKDWIINENALHSLIGAQSNTIKKWSGLSRSQRIFLEAVKRLSDSNPQDLSVRDIKGLCEREYSRKVFPEGHLRKKVIEPLIKSGWISSQGTGAGRGGDSGTVKALPQLTKIKITLPIDDVNSIPSDLRDKLAADLKTIFSDLNSKDTYVKGIALELLSLRIARDIGLFPVCFRERSDKTQGAEVDIIANGVHLHYSRWLIQCKNTTTVHVSDIAKEVGMAVVLKAQVIAIVTTGNIGRTVRQYADGLASSSAFQAVLVDGEILNKYRRDGSDAIIDHLRENAFRVLKQKESQIIEYNEE